MHLLDSGVRNLLDDRYAVHSLDLIHHHSRLGHSHSPLFVTDLLDEVGLLHSLHLRVPLDHLHAGLELLGLQADNEVPYS